MLNDAEQSYSTTQKERLTVAWLVLTLHPNAEGCRFITNTDYQSLRWMHGLKTFTDWSVSRRLRLVEFDFETQHRPERKHLSADALYQLLTNQTDVSSYGDDLLAYADADHSDGPDKCKKMSKTC